MYSVNVRDRGEFNGKCLTKNDENLEFQKISKSTKEGENQE